MSFNVCQHAHLKKQYTKKNKEDVAEYTKLLAKQMEEVKEKYQKQNAKTHRLSLRR
ncbi:rCG28317, partial [Rattus norvegicus]